MRKLTTLRSPATPTGRLAAVALACTLAAAGCTTYLNPGSGEPTRGGAGAGPTVPTSTPGTSYGGNLPMTSAYFATAPTAANRGQFRTKSLGLADPAPGSPSVAVAQAGQSINEPPPILSTQGAVNPSLSSGQSSAPVLTPASVVYAVPQTVTPTGVTASPTSGSGTIGLTTSSANAPAGSSGLPGSMAGMPTINPATEAASTLTLTPTVSSAAVARPTKATLVAGTTSTRSASTTTARKRVVASKHVSAVAISRQPATPPPATKSVPRVRIVQSSTGEVIITNEKKP